MLIRAVDVTSYRVLGRVRIDLAAGLNVVHGENDTGKTTLMNAIKDVLTKRAKIGGAAQRAMQPRDGSTPEIAIEFEHDGGAYVVKKRFAGAKGTAHLIARFADGRTPVELNGEDAEGALRAALGLTPDGGARRRDGAPEGIWPLVWVDQGTSNLAVELNDDTRVALSDRLRAMSGTVLAGAGAESVFAAARAEYRRWFTETTGKASTSADAPLWIAQQALAEATAERDQLAARLRDHESSVDRHAALAREVEALGAQIPALERSANEAEWRAVEVRAHGEKLAAATAESKRAEALLDQATARAATRASARTRVAEEAAAVAKLGARAEEAAAAAKRHAEARAELEAASEAARVELASRDGAYRIARARLDVATARRLLDDADATLTKARAHRDALVAAKAKVAALAGAEATAKALTDNERALERAELALAAAAATIEVRALEEAAIEIDDAKVALQKGDATSRSVDAPTCVRVPGVVEVRITPGGKDLAGARADAEKARSTLRRALEEAGVADAGEARARVDEKRRLDGEAATAAQLLALLAPQGFDALEAARAAHAAQLARSGAALEALGASAESTGDADEEGARDAARTTYEAAREQLAGHDLARQKLDGEARVAESEARAASRRRDDMLEAIARDVRDAGDDAALTEARARAAAEHDERRRAVDAIAAELARMQADDAPDAAARARRAHDRAVVELRDKSAEMNRLHGELRSAHVFGLHERLGDAASRVADAEAESARLTERAEAARLLFETLSSCRDAAQRRFVDPLRREIAPLLRALFADGDVALDDRFGVAKVTRATYGIDEFESLGGGAREQLAILVRLGMASVLAGEGTLPVLLDDAIVFSSEDRFARMTNVLARIARRLQIVLFTCHWERYRALGVDRAIDLAALLRDARAR